MARLFLYVLLEYCMLVYLSSIGYGMLVSGATDICKSDAVAWLLRFCTYELVKGEIRNYRLAA